MSVEHLKAYGFDKMSEEKRRETCAKGGRARAAAIRRRKSLREAAEVFLSLPVQDQELKDMLAADGLKKDDQVFQMAIIAALVKKAAQGDARSAKLVFGLVGEEPREDKGVTIVVDV